MILKCIDTTGSSGITLNREYKCVTSEGTHGMILIINDLDETRDYLESRFEKQYYGDEILKMIRDGELNSGDIYERITGNTITRIFVVGGNANPSAASLFKDRFIIKKKEYISFHEASKTGKNFKYKRWVNGFYDLAHVIYHLGREYAPDEIEFMISEKAWEVEGINE